MADADCVVEGTAMGQEQLLTGREWLCTSAASLCIISCIVSLITIAIIGVNRYLYVCWHNAYHTVFSRRHTVVAVVSTWLVGVALDLPNHLGWSSHCFDAKTQKCLWDRTIAYHYTILFVVVGMLLPFVITIICYWRIFAHIQLAKQRLLRTQLQARLGKIHSFVLRATYGLHQVALSPVHSPGTERWRKRRRGKRRNMGENVM